MRGGGRVRQGVEINENPHGGLKLQASDTPIKHQWLVEISENPHGGLKPSGGRTANQCAGWYAKPAGAGSGTGARGGMAGPRRGMPIRRRGRLNPQPHKRIPSNVPAGGGIRTGRGNRHQPHLRGSGGCNHPAGGPGGRVPLGGARGAAPAKQRMRRPCYSKGATALEYAQHDRCPALRPPLNRLTRVWPTSLRLHPQASVPARLAPNSTRAPAQHARIPTQSVGTSANGWATGPRKGKRKKEERTKGRQQANGEITPAQG